MPAQEYTKLRDSSPTHDGTLVPTMGRPTERAPQRPDARPPLDDDVLLTSAQTRARVGGVSTMCIWRWLRDPRVRFPQPVKINSRNYWRFGDLRRWQAERA
jgi:predicted DNA-binding transcriptional regulator AlpA